jgi:Ribonuclease D
MMRCSSLPPTSPNRFEELGRARLLLREARRGEIAEGILSAIATAQAQGPEDWPEAPEGDDGLQVNPALADLLRVLLKARAESAGVAPRLIASAADLDAIAAGRADLPALSGWRREVFGQDALALCAGQVGLAVKGQSVEVITL